MTSIQPALPEDWGAWRELDRHVCRAGFLAAVRRSMAWWVLEEGQPVGVLSLFNSHGQSVGRLSVGMRCVRGAFLPHRRLMV